MTLAPAPAMPLGISHDEHHRYVYRDRMGRTWGPYPSVTTVIGVVDKSGPLTAWAKRETAQTAVRNHDILERMIRDGGKDAAVAWLERTPDFQRDTKADLGTRVHKIAEHWPGIPPMEPDEAPYVRAYDAFRNTVAINVTHVETAVINTEAGYGGTFDLGCEIDGIPTLLDIKTGKNVYAETALQLAGYSDASGTSDEDGNFAVLPQWGRFGVIHLQPDRWTLLPFTVDETTRAAFHNALRLWHWTRSQAKWVRGEPIEGSSQA